jgi:hypothetical protein
LLILLDPKVSFSTKIQNATFVTKDISEPTFGSYIPRPEFKVIVDCIRPQITKPKIIRQLQYILIEGLSGVGKTVTGQQAANAVIKSSPPHSVVYTFYQLDSGMEVSFDSATVGYTYLSEIFAGAHLNLQLPKLEEPPLNVLQRLLDKWTSKFPTAAGWLVHLDEFQLAPNLIRAVLRAVVAYNNQGISFFA